MQHPLIRIGLVLGAGAWFAACSAGGGGKGPGGGDGDGTNPFTGGSTSGVGGNGANCESGGICIDTGGSMNMGTGGDGPVIPPEPDPCDENGMCAEGFICTVNNECGLIGDSCTEHSQCQGDTYCCGADCRLDGVDEGVCIPGNAGPGAECKGEATIGVFSPALQCEWKTTDEWGSNVAVTPLVGNLPNDSGDSAEMVVISFHESNSAKISNDLPGTLRIIRGDDCTLLETIEDSKNIVRGNTTPAIADLDGDGDMEIVAFKVKGGLIAFAWNGSSYAKTWETTEPAIADSSQTWSSISIHDVDNSGAPEIIAGTAATTATFSSTGAPIGTAITNGGGVAFNGFIPVVGDLNNDGTPELLSNNQGRIYALPWTGSGWTAPGWDNYVVDVVNPSQLAFADFGTDNGDTFDSTALDGIAEIVKVEDQSTSKVAIYTLDGDVVMEVTTTKAPGSTALQESGGPIVIGDADNDGFPEVGVAGATYFRLFDLECAGGGAGCAEPYVRWKTPSQDASSRQTGASIFDFDGDGKAEAVYADECFLRVYAGETGDVLFSSYRTSGTWYENPVVADVDNDQNTEIVVNSATPVQCSSETPFGTPFVDPLHPGVACDDDSDCVPGGTCGEGYCRCAGPADCDAGLTCTTPLSGSGNTCRATNPNANTATGGIRVLRDRLDRWASSRPIWNQHAFSDTNINDDGTVPLMSMWDQNFTVAGKNNYRQNAQGATSVDDIPDVTGKLDAATVCTALDDNLVFTGRVCNRGNRAVGAALPATFYDSEGNILCVSYTQTPVQGNGDCRAVSCQVNADEVSGEVKMVVNDDGNGGRTTIECREDNNSDTVTLTSSCVPVK